MSRFLKTYYMDGFCIFSALHQLPIQDNKKVDRVCNSIHFTLERMRLLICRRFLVTVFLCAFAHFAYALLRIGMRREHLLDDRAFRIPV